MPPLTTPATLDRGVARRRAAEGVAYGAQFWFTYAANTCLMAAVSLLFRYADFVHVLGGTDWHLGWIVGIGMFGSLAIRLVQGVGIDRWGSRQMWVWSIALFSASCLGHLTVDRVDNFQIFAWRVLFNTSIAGAFGASITYISRQAPVIRMAEIVGTLGTSGFVGMVAGPWIGDFLLGGSFRGTAPLERADLNRLFMVAAAMGVCAFVLANLATWGHVHPAKRRKPHVLWLLRRYHPGPVLLVAVVMGFGIGLPGVFLRPYAAQLNISKIAMFFTVYSCMAFITRICIRRFPEKFGIRPMILWGLASLITSMLLYLVVRQPWQLQLPAIFTGIAHAFLFPAVVAGGSASFPSRHRGVGTALMLAMFDLGSLLGMPTVGEILRRAAQAGLDPYPTMFICVAAVLTLSAAIYWLLSRNEPPWAGRRRGRLEPLAIPAEGLAS